MQALNTSLSKHLKMLTIVSHANPNFQVLFKNGKIRQPRTYIPTGQRLAEDEYQLPLQGYMVSVTTQPAHHPYLPSPWMVKVVSF